MIKIKPEQKKKISVIDIIKGVASFFSAMVSIFFFLFFLFIIIGLFSRVPTEIIPKGNIAVIEIKGPILTSRVPWESVASPEKINSFIKKAEEMEEIKALILEINSPGGAPVATDEIAQAIKKFKQKKPVVAVIKDMGASGAYWIASTANRIYANRMSITGSIGVTASMIEWAGLLERYNASYRSLVAGKYKDAGSPFKRITPEEKQLFQNVLDKLHYYFIEEVAKNRNLSIEYVRELAHGFIFLGSEALELKLIDEIGGIEEAKDWLAQQLNITPELARFRSRPTLLEQLSFSLQAIFEKIGFGIGKALVEENYFELR